ncbi:aminodeoxychorismate/anthranilate synthase component II [Lentisphaerota bacterium WC36G]|nr:aminodeoxychorismate/anthranilate synthase component II [Lentisphaerae bacterium WC36]
MILMIDNYDSFTYNLVQYLQTLGKEVIVKRNDEIAVNEALALNPELIVISPGPGTPTKAGISIELIKAAAGKIPVLGICLGHQAIVEAFGGKIIRAKNIMHGKTSKISTDKQGIFSGMPPEITVNRYHSLVAEQRSLPECFVITSKSLDDDEIMGVRHKEFLIEGVQYHPESVLTPTGKRQLAAYLDYVKNEIKNSN